MRKITVYRAVDGVDFNTEKECRDYERELCDNVIKTLHMVHDTCVQHEMDCTGCLFYTDSKCIIMQMTDGDIIPNMWNDECSLDQF